MAFIERLTNAWRIFSFSFQLLKQDKSLIAIPIFLIMSLIPIMALFAGFFFASIALQSRIVMWVFLIVFFLALHCWVVLLLSAQAWMVHEVIQGKDTTIKSGFSRAMKNLLDILKYACVMAMVSLVISGLRRQGSAGQVGASVLSIFTSIAGKLVLPAMIITERTFAQAVAQLKQSTKALPEIALFEVGTRPLWRVINLIGLVIAWLVAKSIGTVGVIICLLIWIPGIIILSNYVNTTFYTVLYLTLIEKKKIKGLPILKA